MQDLGHPAGGPPADSRLLHFVDEVLDNADVTESTWAVQQQRWSEAQLLELVMLVGFYRMLAGFLNAVKVQLEDDLPGWPAAEHIGQVEQSGRSGRTVA
jgi:4-carboxymuconolactone decarboxylase